MTDISAWLLAIYAEQEKVALAATLGPWIVKTLGEPGNGEVWVVEAPASEYGYAVWHSADSRYGVYDGGCDTLETASHIALHDPAAVLADIAAKRAIVELHRPDRELENWFWMDRKCRECGGSWHSYPPSTSPTDIGPEKGCRTLRLLASAHADRPGYQAEWAVE